MDKVWFARALAAQAATIVLSSATERMPIDEAVKLLDIHDRLAEQYVVRILDFAENNNESEPD